MDLRGMSTTFYDSKAISARCSRTDWKFQQNAKYDEISGRKTRVIYLCSAEGKKAGRRVQLHHLPAFVLPALLPERGPGGGFGQPSPSQRNNSRKRLFGPDVGASAGLYLPALAGMA